MIAALPLKEMSVGDKISVMEAIWDDLCQHAGAVTSPEWHKEILDQRERNLRAGTDSFQDWELAKDEIRKKIQ